MSWLRSVLPSPPGKAGAAAWELVSHHDVTDSLDLLARHICAETGRKDPHAARLQLEGALAVEVTWMLTR